MHSTFTILSSTCVGGQMGLLEQTVSITKPGSSIDCKHALKQQSLLFYYCEFMSYIKILMFVLISGKLWLREQPSLLSEWPTPTQESGARRTNKHPLYHPVSLATLLIIYNIKNIFLNRRDLVSVFQIEVLKQFQDVAGCSSQLPAHSSCSQHQHWWKDQCYVRPHLYQGENIKNFNKFV